ncbi:MULTISPECIES: glycoside hydrolase family 9 protein [unclassified Fibrobacter]|uniref:glycoside hydrolase family 9 protein n=1 Tax=unclassified Fibrobacter TaxID=2634177 RepID=UPI0009119640|nr:MULTISPECIES: glycoside hydrolase family 9 protein [unclassified Fibrobacter]OWV06690.1 glycosyl hydrolase family 5 [Fibrobacter sp. UWH3]SHK90423.1 endoglucanase [Fibrobacter sp. UWH6]
MDAQEQLNMPIRYNHIGYLPNGPKVFFLNPRCLDVEESQWPMLYYRIVGASGFADYKGCFEKGSFKNDGVCGYTGESLWSGTFSNVHETGSYRILIFLGRNSGNDRLLFESPAFEISDDWVLRQLKANIKSFYFQRSGVELTREFAGPWARPAAHFDDCIKFHASMNREGVWNAHGGWYDAGDYGKYIVNGGVSVGTLLLACELCDERLRQKKAKGTLAEDVINEGGTFNLPFSLKDEIRFELDFFLKMQDEDGGVFFKVTPERWDGFVTPTVSDSTQKRLILGKSTTSTLNFAGCMAAANRVYRGSDRAFSNRCLGASIRAYQWACRNPEADWPHNTEGSGGYGDSCYTDEFFWVRSMLYRELQGVKSFPKKSMDSLRSILLKDMDKNKIKLGLDWRDTQNFGWIALALQDFDVELRDRARKTLEGAAAEIIRLQQADPYGLSIRSFIWGSNGEISNHALTLMVVNTWRKTVEGQSLIKWSQEQLNFVYGRNPLNVCFVTGSAWSSPKRPHHRLSHSDKVVDPIPGLLVGGINADRQDLHRFPTYPNELPGYSYSDEQCSFASNETAINWNAPLTAVLALLVAYN